MRISCPQCKSQYNVDEKRIPPQGVQIKCPKCTTAFVVHADGVPAGDGAVALPGAAGDGAVALPGAGGGAVPLPGGGGAVALPGGGGAVPLPGGGGAVPLPGGGGGFPFPGGGGAVPLPGGGGAVPLPGAGGMGSAPLPGFGGAVPLPGGGGAVPLPGAGAGVPLPGFGGAAPLPGAGFAFPPAGVGAPRPSGGPGFAPMSGLGSSEPYAEPGVVMPQASHTSLTENSVVHPFHGQTQAKAAPAPAQAAKSLSLDGGVLDFIDRAADQAGVPRTAASFRVRKRSGKVVGPFDEATVLKMLRSSEFVGSEDASQDDGATWRPLSQFPGFAAEIATMMANALGGLKGMADLPAPVRSPGAAGNADLPAPVDRSQADLPTAVRGRKKPGNADGDLPTPSFPVASKGQPGATDAATPGTPAAPGTPEAAAAATADKGKRKKLALAGGAATLLVLVAVGVVLGVPDIRNRLFGSEPEVPAGTVTPPTTAVAPEKPKPVAAPGREGATVEDLLREDTVASYAEAAQKLSASLGGTSAPPLLVAYARSLALPAYLDQQSALTEPALAASAAALAADARGGAGFRAFALLASGKPDDALREAKAVAGEAPPDVKEASPTELAAASWSNTAAGFALLEKKQLTDAMTRFDWALTAWPDNTVATQGQARALLANGDKESAAGYLERQVALLPENVRGRLLLGRTYLQLNKVRQAMDQFLYVAAQIGPRGSAQQRAQAHLGVSDAAAADRDFKLALEEMKSATAQTPDDVQLRLRHGELALRMGDWPQARSVFDEILKGNPGEESAIVGSARAKLGATDALGAYQQLDAAAKLAPQSALLIHWFGEANLRMGKSKEAVDLFKRAQGLDPSRALPTVAQARILMESRRYNDALKLLEPAFGRVAPEEAPLLRAAMGEVLVKQRNYPGAFKAFEEVLAQTPQDSQARALYGRALKDTGKYEEAQRQLKQAVAEDPRNPLILSEMGAYYESQGQYERAIDYFQQALAISPKEAEFHIRLGAATFRRGDSAGALEHLKAAQSLAVNNPDVYYWMGLAVRKTDPDRAKQMFKQGMELAPEDGRFDHELGRSVGAEGAMLEAVDYLRGAVRKDPKNGDAYFEMGKFLAEQSRYADAREQFQRATELMPQKAIIHLAIAETYERAGQYDLARKEYQVAMKKDPNQPEAHCKMGDVYRLDQKLKNAVQAYKSCVELNPRHKTAWRWLGFSLVGLGGKANQKEAVKAFQTHLKAAPDDPENSSVEDQLSDLGVNVE